jgi:hypothetical protein
VHLAAYHLEYHSALDATATVLTVAVPLVVYVVSLLGIFLGLTRAFDPFHLLLAGAVVPAGAAVALAAAGVALGWALAVLALAPWVVVIGYETHGHRHAAEMVARVVTPTGA